MEKQKMAPAESEAPASRGKSSRAAAARRGAEPYDTLLWRLQPLLESSRGVGSLVGVIGAEPGVGVTTVAANLAIRAADHRLSPTLLVDCNAARPRLGRHFHVPKGPGFAEVLAGDCSLADATYQSKVEGLYVLPLGSAKLLDSAGLDPQQFEAAVNGLRESYELVVFDMPSAGELRHQLLTARRTDAALLVVRSEATTRRTASLAASRLRADGVNLVGSFVTRQRQYLPTWVRRRF
jgi:Mrp family chromosome partitioning ATPase